MNHPDRIHVFKFVEFDFPNSFELSKPGDLIKLHRFDVKLIHPVKDRCLIRKPSRDAAF